jgi:hypothetical protein
MPVITLSIQQLKKDYLQQVKIENVLMKSYAKVWKRNNKRVEVHTPWRSNPMIYFNDELTDTPYTRLYLKITGDTFRLHPIKPMEGFEAKDFEERFMKLKPPA